MSTPNSPVSPILGSLVATTTGTDSSSSDSDVPLLTPPTTTTAGKNYGTKTPSGNPRIYNCKTCLRAFTREEHLTRHTLSTHNKLKPFTCGICSRPFSRRDLLLRHAKNLHQGSELAVSRIRKSYKRDNSNNINDKRGRSISVGSAELMSISNSSSSSNGSTTSTEGYDDYAKNYNITTPPTPPTTRVTTNTAPLTVAVPVSVPVTSPPTSSSTSTSAAGSPTTFQKRFKISVNMLVS